MDNFEKINSLYNKAGKLIEENQFESAIEIYNEILGLDSNYYKAYFQRANSYMSLGKIDNAIEDFSKGLNINDDVYAHLLRASAYDAKKMFEESIEDYSIVIGQVTDSEILKLTYSNRGSAYNDLHQTENALNDFIKALELDPNNTEIIRMTAFLFNSLKQISNAINAWSKLLKLIPDDLEGLQQRAKLNFEKTRFDDVIDDCNRAIKLNPQDSQMYLIRGGAFYEKGEVLKAKSDLQIAKNKGNPTAKKMLDQLAKDESDNLYRMKNIEAFNVDTVDNDKAAHFFRKLSGNETFTLDTNEKPLSMMFFNLSNNLPQYSYANGFLLSISIDDAETKTGHIDKIGDFLNQHALAAIKVEQGGNLEEAKITVKKDWKSIYNKDKTSSKSDSNSNPVSQPTSNKKGCLSSIVFVLLIIIIIIVYLL